MGIHAVRMRVVICIFWIVCSTLAFGSGGGSALHALQTVAAQDFARDATIVEVRGVRGEPMPPEWTVLLSDPTARGGVREVVLASGRILSERAPMHGFTEIANLPAIDLQKVSLDAGNIFQNVNTQATALKVGFHWIDYTLRTDPLTMQPVWTVKLFDKMGSEIGVSRISADGSSIIQPLTVEGEEGVKKRPGGLVGQVVGFSESAGRKIGNTTLRAIGGIQEFLIGERTVGPAQDE